MITMLIMRLMINDIYCLFLNNLTIGGPHFTELISIVLMMINTSDNDENVDCDQGLAGSIMSDC